MMAPVKITGTGDAGMLTSNASPVLANVSVPWMTMIASFFWLRATNRANDQCSIFVVDLLGILVHQISKRHFRPFQPQRMDEIHDNRLGVAHNRLTLIIGLGDRSARRNDRDPERPTYHAAVFVCISQHRWKEIAVRIARI